MINKSARREAMQKILELPLRFFFVRSSFGTSR